MTSENRVAEIIALAAMILILWVSFARAQTPPVEVIDGDTVRISGTTYRLVGYDTPEVYAIERPCPAEHQLGLIASARLRSLMPITVEPVPCWGGRKSDRYGRTCGLARTQGGEDVGAVLVREGLANPLSLVKAEKRADWCKRPALRAK
jgi:endonuclease YncB( thermonuclease family)